MDLIQTTQILQSSIAPIALISGIGLVLLSATNRYGRVIDRVRLLCEKEVKTKERESQIEMLYLRARVLRLSISAALLSILLTAVIIMLLFIMAAFSINLSLAILGLFSLSMLFVIVSMAAHVYDLTLSLKAIKVVIGTGKEK